MIVSTPHEFPLDRPLSQYAAGKLLAAVELRVDTGTAIAQGGTFSKRSLALMGGEPLVGGVLRIKAVILPNGSRMTLFVASAASGVQGDKDQQVAEVMAGQVMADWALFVRTLAA